MAKDKLKKRIEDIIAAHPEKFLRLGIWGLTTVVCHNLNIGGIINWFGKANDRVPTGLPGPFAWRRRFPWESQPEPTLEDKICEWAIPALASYTLVYHPDAIAKFVDAMIPL